LKKFSEQMEEQQAKGYKKAVLSLEE